MDGHPRRLAGVLSTLALSAAICAVACNIDVPIATPNAPTPAPIEEPPPPEPIPPPRMVHGQPDTAPPEVTLEILGSKPEGATIRPTLLSSEGQTTAGTAFACTLDDASPPLLCTAFHLFGPGGGLSREYAWDELDELVDHIEGTGFLEEAIFINASEPLPIEDAMPMKPPDFNRDLAVFRLEPPGRVHVLRFAAEPPAPGTEVFLIAELQSGPQTDRLRHPAEVLDSDEAVLAYKFKDPTIDLRATSGAPIVDAQGHAVGVHLAGAYDDVQGLLGVAVPGVTARAQIARALEAANAR